MYDQLLIRSANHMIVLDLDLLAVLALHHVPVCSTINAHNACHTAIELCFGETMQKNTRTFLKYTIARPELHGSACLSEFHYIPASLVVIPQDLAHLAIQ